MTQLRIQNFGPIRDSGWLNIGHMTVLIGPQGSGKSSIAKLATTFIWMEKVLFRGDFTKARLCDVQQFLARLRYHRIDTYVRTGTRLEYQGEYCKITCSNKDVDITTNPDASYHLPQIIYIPSERNFLSFVRNPDKADDLSGALRTFVTEFNNAKSALGENPAVLPLDETRVVLDSSKENLLLTNDRYSVPLTDASSGYQSFVPLYLVADYLGNRAFRPDDTSAMNTPEAQRRFALEVEQIWASPDMTDEQKRITVSTLAKRFIKATFINIVEEPEQNLFPDAQGEVLKKLVELNKRKAGNKLFLTTHSPYILTHLNNMLQAGLVLKRDVNAELPVPALDAESTAVYQVADGMCVSLIDPETDLVGENAIDACSDKIYQQFDRLLNLETHE